MKRRVAGRVSGALVAVLLAGVGHAVAQVAPDDSPDRPTAVAPESAPGSELRVWLVTAGPGDAVWERYGHNAIRVLDTESGRDVSYNWGIFDFQQVDFIPRFLQGRMLYMMAPFPTRAMIEAYGRANREILLQELDLQPAQKVLLRDFAENNALPENRDYFYQYFRDNCSTRVRDLLDLALGGQLRARFGSVATGTSYRTHTRRLMSVDPLIYTGMDLLLGAPTDQPISVWDEMFLPMTLRDEIRNVRLVGTDGVERPLVLSEEIAVSSTRAAERAEPPSWFLAYAIVGLAVGLLFASAGTARVRGSTALRRTVAALAGAWSLLGGLLGTILVLLLFTDHTFAFRNENLFLFNPLLLGLAVLLPVSTFVPRWEPKARALALTVATLALVGLIWQLAPWSLHVNGEFFALALPAHLGMAFALRTSRPVHEGVT